LGLERRRIDVDATGADLGKSMSLRIAVASVVTLFAALGCSGQTDDGAAGAAGDSAQAGATGSAGSANGGAGMPASAGAASAGSAGAASGGGGSGGASNTGGAPLGGCSSATCGGSGGSTDSGGQAGGSGRQLQRVLAYDHVDINPDTGTLRGHTGGGADEKLLQTLATEHGFELVITDKAADFSKANLARFDAVAFASPDYAGQALSAVQRDALEAFVRQGGGWVGWHYALWVEKDWPFMSVLGGGVAAKGHVGALQAMTFTVVDSTHPILRGVPQTFDVKDDFLAMTGDPSQDPKVSILVRAALTAAPGGNARPVIWAHDVDKGRAYYSMLGHFSGDFTTPEAKTLMWNALRWVTRTEP
jgi:type 1 glutamine amidotransferase